MLRYIQVNYPQYKVLPYLAETLERGPKKMVLRDKIFNPFQKPDMGGKPYCVIVCDNATLERMIGLEYYQNATVSIVVDHHASNEGYGDVNWTEVSEACAENVYHMLDSQCLRKAQKQRNIRQQQTIFILESLTIPVEWQGRKKVHCWRWWI